MKDYKKFLEEATIKGNTGIPGEKDKSDTKKYLSDVETKGAGEIRPFRTGDNPSPLIHELCHPQTGLLPKAIRLSRGHEEELEEFAEKMIRDVYPGILANVDLDIKIVRGDEVSQLLEPEEGEEEEGEEEAEPIASTDKELRFEIDKRKLSNAIMQGEAKNTKLIIEMPECRDGLKRILGDRNGLDLHTTLVRIAKIANQLDWIIPVDVKADMMESAPEGMAGAVKVDYKNKEKKEKTEKTAEEILKSLEEGEEMEDMGEEIEEVFAEGKPTIKAVGVDFSMLIHEVVKGIYELISRAGIPKDERLAKNVMMNTSSFSDEAEDFKYGPYIAADLRDFINKNPKIDKYPNMREYVFGKLILIPAEQFLDSMKNILMESPKGRKIVDDLVDGIIAELDEYEKQVSAFDAKDKLGELEEEPEERTPETPKKSEKPVVEPEAKEVDYSKMSRRDLQSEADDALDANDIEKFKKISQFLAKESVAIYLKEFERLNESHIFHNRRKK